MTGRRIVLASAGVAAVLILGAAQPPSPLVEATGGMWEVTGVPGSNVPVRQCIADVTVLAQFEHRRRNCKRNVLSNSGSSTVISYSCGNGEFGQSKLTVITPRSLKIETQGISDNSPFNYVLQAHRMGDCSGH
jgi:hypothetical protein